MFYIIKLTKKEVILMEHSNDKKWQAAHDKVDERIAEAGGLLQFIEKARKEGKLIEFKPLPETNHN
jgi:hypothetical protein